jgi:hypothetical protein
MAAIEIKTLLDITRTQVNRLNQGTQFELDQNRNFVTLLQCAEIRSIISYDQSPTMEEIDIKNVGFGSKYKGKQKVWTFRFTPDREGVYLDDWGNPVGLIEEDLTSVPVVKNLLETINIDTAVFNCTDLTLKNTIIKAIPGNS